MSQFRTSLYKCLMMATAFVFVSGCMNTAKKKTSDSQKYIQQVSQLEKEVKDLATQNLVLKSALKKPKSPLKNSDSPSVVEISGEHSLYTAALEAYWARDIEKLKRLNSMLIKTFPQSVHADNALYLQASLLYNQGAFGESLQVLNRISKDYSNANKSVSADLMKAMIYSRLNLKEQSTELYRKIIKQYPGSPEARQALLQMEPETKISSSKRTIK